MKFLKRLSISIFFTLSTSILASCGGGGGGSGGAGCSSPPATLFSNAQLVTELNSIDADEAGEVSNDNLSFYLSSNRAGGNGSTDIYEAKRSTTTSAWGTPVNIGTNINSASNDRAATVSSDGLTMIFASDRDGNFDLYSSTRASVSDPWGAASNMGSSINTAFTDNGPSLSGDGLTLVFHSDRADTSGSFDLYISTRTSTSSPWSTPVNLGSTVNTAAPEVAGDISCDGLRIYFHSPKTGNFEIYMTKRTSNTGAWSSPVLVASPVNTSDMETAPSISADEKTLYFSSDRAPGDARDIWMVSR